MITSGALASIENSVFDSNATPNYGSFAGGIFHVRTLRAVCLMVVMIILFDVNVLSADGPAMPWLACKEFAMEAVGCANLRHVKEYYFLGQN